MIRNKWKNLSKRKKRIVIIGLIVLVLGFLFFRPQPQIEEEKQDRPIAVSLLDLSQSENRPSIQTIGTVKPISQIDVISLGAGTVTQVHVNPGQDVFQGQKLVSIFDQNTYSNFQTIQVQYLNAQQNYDSATQMATDTVAQAELHLLSAQDAYDSAKLNFDSGIVVSENQNTSTKENAVIAYQGFVAFVNQTMNDVNYIIKAEGQAQIPGISSTLAALNSQSLISAKNTYRDLEREFNALQETNTEMVTLDMQSIVNVMNTTNTLVSQTINVLDNTTSSASFSEETLNAQRQRFAGIKSSLVAQQTQARQTLLTLQNLSFQSETTIDGLQLNLQQATNRLESAKKSLENAKLAAKQQIAGAENSLQAMTQQFQMAQKSVNDLTISAPISGKLTQKFVTVGQQINPGQKVAQVSQTNALEIRTSVLPVEAKNLQLGQSVMIDEDIQGTIHIINPVADPVTKKVEVIILFDYENQTLLPESSVGVSFMMSSDKTDSIWIPLKAVTITDTESYVFIAEENTAKKISVTVSQIQKDYIEIIDGLEKEMKVVVEGSKQLVDGSIIQ